MGIVELSDYRLPVNYMVRISQGYDGSLTVSVEDLQDDPRSRQAVADALRDAAKLIEDRIAEQADGRS